MNKGYSSADRDVSHRERGQKYGCIPGLILVEMGQAGNTVIGSVGVETSPAAEAGGAASFEISGAGRGYYVLFEGALRTGGNEDGPVASLIGSGLSIHRDASLMRKGGGSATLLHVILREEGSARMTHISGSQRRSEVVTRPLCGG